MKCNVYVGDYRAVKISGKWRVCKRNPNSASRTEWLFVNETEYDSASEALHDFI